MAEPDFIFDYDHEVLLPWGSRDSMMYGTPLWTIKEFTTSIKDLDDEGALISGPSKWAVRTSLEDGIEWFDDFFDALELTIKKR